MATGESLERVLVFDDFHNDTFRNGVIEGANQAGWEGLAFKNPHDALRHFDEHVGALVTALGIMERFPRKGVWRFPGELLVDLSQEQGTPRAILSNHPHAGDFIRRGSSDIVVPKKLNTDISNIFHNWFIKLSECR